ncbi:uncharacterized protein ACNS7B_013375 [Menidia menidia]
MNLWLSCSILSVALFLSSSAPTPEECQPLVTPLLITDSLMGKKFNFYAGFTDQEIYRDVLKITDSSWITFTESPSNKSEVIMSQENRLNGTCFGSKAKIDMTGEMIETRLPNMTWTLQRLPSCDTCLVLEINSTMTNNKDMLNFIKLDRVSVPDEIQARAVYLFSTELTVKDSDLEHFKKQASCFDFSGELHYLFNPEKTFCKEGEGIKLPYSQ